MKGKRKLAVHVVAQSHIDLAWLWRWEETVNVCCKNTFGQATRNLDNYDSFTFSQSQVPLYKATEDHHPAIFEKIMKYVKSNRWEIAGGFYVEFEGGEPCGESIVRQCMLGKRYFKERFGIDVTTAWQEDAWTHPWQLPQILLKCGIKAYFFKRGVHHPQIFWWESPDGSRILAVKPLHVLRGVSLPILDRIQVWWWARKWQSRYSIEDILIRIGKGDHGGGPQPSDIDTVLAWAKKHENKIDIKFSTFEAYKDLLYNTQGHFPLVVTEIDHELHGDLTNCCEIKRRNRNLETLLITAEKFGSLAILENVNSFPRQSLNAAWEQLLFTQFHDIIGGSGIPPVNEDTHAMYDSIERSCKLAIESSLAALSSAIDTRSRDSKAIPVIIFNTLSWER